MIFLSPGVKTREVDYSTYIGQISTCIVGMIGGAGKGPIEEPTLCTSPADYQEVFGEPIPDDFGSYAALEFLKQGNQLYYLRVANETSGRASTYISNGLIHVIAKEVGSWYEYHKVGCELVALDVDLKLATIVVYKDNIPEETLYVSLEAGNKNYPWICDPSVSRLVNFEFTELSDTVPEIVSPAYGETDAGSYGPAYAVINGEESLPPYNFVQDSNNKWLLIGGDNDQQFDPAPCGGEIKYIYLRTTVPVDPTRCKFEIIADNAYRDGGPNGPDLAVLGVTNVTDIPSFEVADAGSVTLYGECEDLPVKADGTVQNGIRINLGNSPMYKLSLNNRTNPWEVRFRVTLVSAFGIEGKEELIIKSLVSTMSEPEDYVIPVSPTPSMGIGPTAIGNTTPSAKWEISKDISYLRGGCDGTPLTSKEIIGKGTSGLQAFRNVEELEVNILAAPGHYEANVQTELLNICETRADCMAVLDPPQGLSRKDMIDYHNGKLPGEDYPKAPLSSSYGAIYYPWVQIYDIFSGENKWVPPSGVVCGAYAYNDNVGQPWFAPAGLNRGMLSSVVAVEVALDEGARDALYGNGNCVNSIVNYKRQGFTIWGQRTLLRRNSALDRVNVRRLLNLTRKAIAASTAYLIFEQNDELTWRRWRGTVTPYLESIKSSRGLYDYLVIMDATTVTPYHQDRNEMPGKIFLKPTKTAEFIPIDFVITTSGASFTETE